MTGGLASIFRGQDARCRSNGWRPEEESLLADVIARGGTFDDAAAALPGRSRSAVKKRACLLGLKVRRHSSPARKYERCTAERTDGEEERRIALYSAQIGRGEPIAYLPYDDGEG